MTEKENAIYEFEMMATWCESYSDDELRAINYVRRLLHSDIIDTNKILTEIERQEKWLMDAGYNTYNVDIAFSSIKSALQKARCEMKAYKCDRCGKLFEGYNYQGTREFYSITRNPYASGNCLDLCPDCNAELQEWVANDKEQAESEDKE